MISHDVSGELFQQSSNKPCSDVATVSVYQCDRSGESSEASVFYRMYRSSIIISLHSMV